MRLPIGRIEMRIHQNNPSNVKIFALQCKIVLNLLVSATNLLFVWREEQRLGNCIWNIGFWALKNVLFVFFFFLTTWHWKIRFWNCQRNRNTWKKNEETFGIRCISAVETAVNSMKFDWLATRIPISPSTPFHSTLLCRKRTRTQNTQTSYCSTSITYTISRCTM